MQLDLQLLCPARQSSLAWRWMGTTIAMTRLRTCAERRYFTFVRYVIFVLVWLKGWLTLLVVFLLRHESTTLTHCTQECHLLILTNYSWCRTQVCTRYDSETLSGKRYHIQPSLKRLHWLPICQHVNLKVAVLTYSIHYSDEPQHLNSLLMNYKPTRSIYGLPKNIYLLFHGQSIIFQFQWALSVGAPKFWNNLPLDIRNSKTMSIFRKLLKTYLYKQAYEHC